jgi:UDP-3-O-[3-hydroxymyristoyl] glucosamine N-acyltransferase
MKHDYSLGEIAAFLNAELRGDADVRISGLNSLDRAESGDLAFLANPKYISQLTNTRAGAVILAADQADSFSGNSLVLNNPYLGYARISAWFNRMPISSGNIHSSAVIHPSVDLKDNVSIGPNVVVDEGAVIGSGSSIAANSFIGSRSVLGADCLIAANVSVYHDVVMGDEVTVHSGSVIGADGFGFAPNGEGGWQKIYQLGGVRIGDRVEIGACSTVDRGALEDTVVGNSVIIDNHVQIAHNCVVGDGTAMAAFSGLAGSVKLGRNCVLAGYATVSGHLSICDNVTLTAHAYVTKSIVEPGSYSSSTTPLMESLQWRKTAVRIGQLEDIVRRLKILEDNKN